MTYQIVTIDGPAGAGKTTVSKALARELNCIYVDTGALYRGVAYEIQQQDIDWENDDSLQAFLTRLDLNFSRDGEDLVLTSSGTDITSFIRTPEISMLASASSARPAVREALLDIQRQIARQQDAVFEGRDMGTIVFPDASFKFFLFADLTVRAKRRFDELGKSGAELNEVLKDMETRDKNDSQRQAAPLKPADDAVHIDSTDLSVDQVVEKMASLIKYST